MDVHHIMPKSLPPILNFPSFIHYLENCPANMLNCRKMSTQVKPRKWMLGIKLDKVWNFIKIKSDHKIYEKRVDRRKDAWSCI